MLLSICLLFLLLILYSLHRYYRFVARYPPGPTPKPFIGNFLEFDFGRVHSSYERLSEGFNGVCTIFTPQPVVHIRDYELIREALVEKGEDFVDRPQFKQQKILRDFVDNGGVTNSIGENWREQRRTAISILRDFGMGKNLMEELVKSSTREFLECLDNIEDKNHADFRWPVQIMVANIINEILFGFRYKYDDAGPLMRYVTDLNTTLAKFAKNKLVFLGVAFPILTRLPWIGWHTYEKYRLQARQVNQHIVDSVERASRNHNEEDEPTCFVHAYKQRIWKNPFLDEPNLLSTCADFFSAGQETVVVTLQWAFLILASDQRVQDRLREEIFATVGKEEMPSMVDQTSMPYARAVVYEIQRFANILGQNVPRVTVRDTEVGGHFIPKGTAVNADIHFVMADDPHFENPHEFRPERYLSEDGMTLRKDLLDRTLPFSLGKRVCAGEGLARAELFICITATVQRYRLIPRDGEKINLEPQPLRIKRPHDQTIRIERVA